jgi:hypothetical protein
LAWHRQRPCGGLVGGGARLQRHGSNVRIVSDAPGWACAGRAWIVALNSRREVAEDGSSPAGVPGRGGQISHVVE